MVGHRIRETAHRSLSGVKRETGLPHTRYQIRDTSDERRVDEQMRKRIYASTHVHINDSGDRRPQTEDGGTKKEEQMRKHIYTFTHLRINQPGGKMGKLGILGAGKLPYYCRECSTNQPFYAKQTQFRTRQIHIRVCITTDYEKTTNL